jgi:hypothetical protein
MMAIAHAREAQLVRGALVCAVLALPVASCAASAGTRPQPSPALNKAGSLPARTTSIARLTALARRRYAAEVHGSEAHATLRRVANDPALLGVLRSGDQPRVRAYVRREFDRVWYHWHVSRLRIVRGRRVLVDVGVPFVVAPSQMTLRGARGGSLGTLQISMQDVIGFVRYMHRNYPVDVVVRGRGTAHVRTSLPAARSARLPDSGTATIAGTRYEVRSFAATGLGGEPVKVWILQR